MLQARSQSLTYKITSEPTCLGYDAGSTSITAKLLTASGVILYFGTDLTVYNDCLQNHQTCLYHNHVAKTLYWVIYDETLTGINTIYIVPTFKGSDGTGLGVNLVNTYTDATSGSFKLTVASCLNTVFGTPTDSLTIPATVGTPNFVTKNN